MKIFMCFSTQHNLVGRKHPIIVVARRLRSPSCREKRLGESSVGVGCVVLRVERYISPYILPQLAFTDTRIHMSSVCCCSAACAPFSLFFLVCIADECVCVFFFALKGGDFHCAALFFFFLYKFPPLVFLCSCSYLIPIVFALLFLFLFFLWFGVAAFFVSSFSFFLLRTCSRNGIYLAVVSFSCVNFVCFVSYLKRHHRPIRFSRNCAWTCSKTRRSSGSSARSCCSGARGSLPVSCAVVEDHQLNTQH